MSSAKPLGPISAKDMRRFHAKVDVRGPQECWPWLGYAPEYRNLGKRGRFRLNDRAVSAARVAYAIAYSEPTDKELVDHICCNPICVNPTHLRPITNKQNQEHRVGATRTSRSGLRGVDWVPSIGKWRASVRHNGVKVSGGLYGTPEQADAAARSLRAQLFTFDDFGAA